MYLLTNILSSYAFSSNLLGREMRVVNACFDIAEALSRVVWSVANLALVKRVRGGDEESHSKLWHALWNSLDGCSAESVHGKSSGRAIYVHLPADWSR